MPQLLYDNGCIVDFQMGYSKEISVSKALGGYEPVCQMELPEDNAGNIVIDLHSREADVGVTQNFLAKKME